LDYKEGRVLLLEYLVNSTAGDLAAFQAAHGARPGSDS